MPNDFVLFELKKLLGSCLVPLSAVLAVGALGVILLWRAKRVQPGRWLVTFALGGLMVFSNRGVATLILRPLESAHPPLSDRLTPETLPRGLAECEAIVVLGSGHSEDPAHPSLHRLNPAALANLAQAVRLSQLLPDARLIVSGGHGRSGGSHAQILAEGAMSLGVAPGRITRIDHTLDTDDEAVEAARRLGARPFALVTSAAHMPRALALFRQRGATAFPCPALFLGNSTSLRFEDFLAWDAEALEGSRKAIKERFGLLWARVRHQTR